MNFITHNGFVSGSNNIMTHDFLLNTFSSRLMDF
jgi:hypothetical protein